jgi:hypothetical protein
MTAQPADIALYTRDGELITQNDPTIKAAHVNALDAGTTELDTFFDNPADAATMTNLRFGLLSMVGRTHDGVSIADTLDLGTSVPLAPKLPRFQIIDDSRGVNGLAAVASYSFDMGSDIYALELTAVPS